jgi:hypothetical protein
MVPTAERPPGRATVLFVFGMGRSGSSALARVLALCGGTLPAALIGATEANPLGHWEPRDALEINEAFLSRHGATWHDPTLHLQGEVAFSSELRGTYLAQIQSFLCSQPQTPLLIVKEPRITALSAFWFEAASQLGFSIRVVIPVRHPEEVIASLATRDRASPELSSALWMKYNLLAERESRGLPRVFVEYGNLLRDWRTEISRIAAALSVDLSVRDESAIDEFLRQDLRRHRHGGQISEVFGLPWVSRTYAALSAASRDEPCDTHVLDEIFGSYHACERAFRAARDEFRTRFGPAGMRLDGVGQPAVDEPATGVDPATVRRNPNISRLIYAVAGRGSQALKACCGSLWYIERNPDVVAARLDPYEHWLAYGANEGRLPCGDPLWLLDRLMQERTSQP